MTKPIINTNKLAHHSDAALLSHLVRAQGGASANERAQALLDRAGSLRNLIDQNDGIGDALSPAEHSRLIAGMELARRASFETLKRVNTLSSPEKVREYLTLAISSRHNEVFCVVYLDNRHRVLDFEETFFGTVDGASVHPRVVVKNCLQKNAAAVIFAHNHPSGVAEPSEADIAITRKLSDALSLVDVRVLDHLIVGAGVQTSLAERGLI